MPILDTIDPGNACGSVPIPELPKIPPRPITYPCAECSEVFSHIESLRRHRLNDHPLMRPYLYLEGRSHHLGHYVITAPLTSADLHFINTEAVSIDGGSSMDAARASELICQARFGRKNLELQYSGYSVSYTLDFQLISDEVAQLVEEAFLDCGRSGGSLPDRLMRFNDRIQSLDSSSRGYAAALDRYLVGIMAKDRVEACQVPYEEYVDKLGESLELLSPIRRPFADTLASVIRLMLNEFSGSGSEQNIPILAATRSALCKGEFADADAQEDVGSSIPVDEVTENVIRFATASNAYRTANSDSVENLLKSHTLSDLDRLKLHLLLMAWYGRNRDDGGMQRHFAKVRHVHQVSGLARKIFERYSE